jgi:hypothetical protein
MSLYTPEDERRIRAQALVREWTKSGLLDTSQGAALEAELRVNVRRTNRYLRAGLALFTALIIVASAVMPIVALRLGRVPSAAVLATFALVCFRLAQYLVVNQRFYRFGVEEALAVGSVLLMAVGAAAIVDAPAWKTGDASVIAGLLVAAAGGLGIYTRFGYVYAMIGTVACVADIPFQLRVSEAMQHGLAAAALGATFLLVRRQRLRYTDGYPGDDYALAQAAACGGLYLALNLQLTFARIGGPFHWFTYATIWVLPVAGLYLAIRDKDRPLLDVNLLMLLITLLTNKAYLGWPRHEWDAMVLGVFMMGGALAVRRWLAAGPQGQRGGFTPARILSKETGAVTMLGTASAGFQPAAPSYSQPGGPGFDGGRSGGGGASGNY